ncbi:hypothetical protein A0W34_09415 [Rhodococcus sp. BH4]|nr:hypothetical protein A0W34_09415 [Rhodococcus sp. BH4]
MGRYLSFLADPQLYNLVQFDLRGLGEGLCEPLVEHGQSFGSGIRVAQGVERCARSGIVGDARQPGAW